MNILHILPGYGYGGVQVIVTKLAATQRLAGMDARVLAISSHPQFLKGLEEEKIPYYCADYKGRHNPWLWWEFSACQKEVRPDILSFHLSGLWYLLAINLVMTKDCPWIFHAHTYPPLTDYPWIAQDHQLYPPLNVRINSGIKRALMHRSIDAIIGVSHSVTAACQRYYGPVIRTYQTIYNGVEIPDGVPLREEWPLFMGSVPPGRPLIGFGTRLAKDKGIKEFLDVLPGIARQLPGARFVLAGDGPLKEWAGNYASSLGLKGKIGLPGFIGDMPAFWANLDFALFTSPREAFPMSLLEALSLGPVVVGYLNSSGSDEAVVHGESGLLVPWGCREALAQNIAGLWQDKGRYAKMSQNARDRVRSLFSLRSMSQECTNLYQTLSNIH